MFQAEDRLPSMVTLVSGSYGDQFAGHIRSFINYDSSACFIKYIKDTYGLEKLDAVYDTGDYAGVFGKDLHTLNTNWQASLAHVKQPADSSEFMRILDKVIAGYEDYFAKTPRGGHINWNAYLAIDRARMALLSGDLAKAEGEVATYYGLMGE
jgi:hypothetical protein